MEKERRINDGGDFYQVHWSTETTTSSSSSSPSQSRSPPGLPESPTAVGVGVNGGPNYIVHPVSKFDTLAGVAIKYGVEVADIKRMNGLVTDLQMFALKTIHIPLPGRHPPSPGLSNGLDTPERSEQTPSSHRHSELFDSLQSLKLKSSSGHKVSPAMSSLQCFYGIKPAGQKTAPDGFEMAVYRNGAHYLEDGPFGNSSPMSNPPLSHHRKSKSVASDLMSNGHVTNQIFSQETEDSKWIEKLTRRVPKSETSLNNPRTPEKLLKEDNSNTGGFSAITGKSLALRAKSASRDSQAGVPNLVPVPLGGPNPFIDSSTAVRKSSSTSCLHDSDNGRSIPKWSMKPDIPPLSAAGPKKQGSSRLVKIL